MYLIGCEEVRVAINRENSLEAIMHQLSGLDNRQLVMVSDYIRGLKASDKIFI